MSLQGFQDRLKQAMDGDTTYSFAKKCGISESLVRKYLSGESLPGLEKLYQLAGGGQVRVEWLTSGEEPMRSGEPGESRVGTTLDAEYFLVPRYAAEASAGPGAVPGEYVADFVAFKTEWLRQELGVNPGKLAAIQARGDSMEPTIHSGDLLLIDLNQPDWRTDAIYAISVGDTLIVKRLQFLISGKVDIISDNPKYAPQTLTREEFAEVRIIGRVAWFGRQM